MDASSDNDAETLKALREAAGLDIAQLASLANLSPGQVRQLEGGGDSHFYSPSIKAQTMRRVLRLLQNQPSEEDMAAQAALEKVPKSVNVIDDIIRLSEKNFKDTIDTSLVRRPSSPYKALLLVGAGLIVVFVLLHWQANQTEPQNLLTEWVEPLKANSASDVADPKEQEQPPPPAPLAPPPVAPPPLAATSTVTETVSPSIVATPVVQVKIPDKPPESPTASNTPAQTAGDCQTLSTEPTPVTPVSVHKPGTYVYMLPSKDAQVCIEDGKRVKTVLNLKAGQGKTIHGSAPWVISSAHIDAVQVYFQGSKVMLPKGAGQRIVLKEQAVSASSNNLQQ